MEKIHHNKCQVCGSSQFSLFLKTEDYFYSQEAFDLYQCSDCGFVFTQDVVNEKEIGKYYKSQDYISHSDTKEGLVNKLYHLSRDYMLGRKAKIIEGASCTESRKLLDIGSGTGYFLNFMRSRKWEVTGIEQDSAAREFSRETFKLNVYSPDELHRQSDAQYDVVTMWHVLEHVLPINDYLEKIYSILKNDGFLFIAVPNYVSFDAKYYKKYWAAYDVPRHLWHFSPGSLIKLLDKHNLKVSEIKRMPLDSFYISIVSEGYRKNKIGLFTGFVIGFISFIVSLFTSKKSSSVLYLIEKK